MGRGRRKARITAGGNCTGDVGRGICLARVVLSRLRRGTRASIRVAVGTIGLDIIYVIHCD
jgi:threonine/homoserine/homoserine lactone efflux protein